MAKKISRRSIVKQGLLAGAVAPVMGLLGGTAGAVAPPLNPNDPTAKALAFVTNAAKVNATENPTYRAGQNCGTCALYQGKSSDPNGGCSIFSGRTVPSAGWCKVWAKRLA